MLTSGTVTFSFWSQNGMAETILTNVPIFMLTTGTITFSFWFQNGMAETALANDQVHKPSPEGGGRWRCVDLPLARNVETNTNPG